MENTVMEATLSVEQKIALAERVSAVDVDDLDSFCTERGLQLNEVTSWSTAYGTGGKLGVQALVVQTRLAPARLRELKEQVRSALRVYRPRTLRIRDEGNWFTIEEVKTLSASSIIYTPFVQLRVVADDEGIDRWFLFWRRAGGSWWPYASKTNFANAADALFEAHADLHRCFRLHPMY